MFTLPIKWTSIGNLGWIALPPCSSFMKCEAFHLRRRWVERNSFPSWPELGIVHLAHRVTHPLSLWGHEHFRVALSEDQVIHSMSMKFRSTSSQKSCSFLISPRSFIRHAKLLRVLQSSQGFPSQTPFRMVVFGSTYLNIFAGLIFVFVH